VYTPATSQLSFFDFITLATTEDIKKFLTLASTTPEGKNLENLWRRAHGEGYKKGKISLLQDLEKKMEHKFEEGVDRGMDLGHEQGYTVAKEGFDGIIKALKARDT
jgi:flagellar biosynthesis/type III secretory pathway protein FliH